MTESTEQPLPTGPLYGPDYPKQVAEDDVEYLKDQARRKAVAVEESGEYDPMLMRDYCVAERIEALQVSHDALLAALKLAQYGNDEYDESREKYVLQCCECGWQIWQDCHAPDCDVGIAVASAEKLTGKISASDDLSDGYSYRNRQRGSQ